MDSVSNLFVYLIIVPMNVDSCKIPLAQSKIEIDLCQSNGTYIVWPSSSVSDIGYFVYYFRL